VHVMAVGLPNGKMEVLATSLLDEEKHPTCDFVEVYHCAPPGALVKLDQGTKSLGSGVSSSLKRLGGASTHLWEPRSFGGCCAGDGRTPGARLGASLPGFHWEKARLDG
jgi:hypothetical protein